MDTLMAFTLGEATRGRDMMVFDWDKAAGLIAERKPEEAWAGLQGDWEWTGGMIYAFGKPDKHSYTYLSSTWATPELDLDGEIVECYVMQSQTKWGSGTKWPASALKILGENK